MYGCTLMVEYYLPDTIAAYWQEIRVSKYGGIFKCAALAPLYFGLLAIPKYSLTGVPESWECVLARKLRTTMYRINCACMRAGSFRMVLPKLESKLLCIRCALPIHSHPQPWLHGAVVWNAVWLALGFEKSDRNLAVVSSLRAGLRMRLRGI